MTWTNKTLDEALEHVAEAGAFALAHANDNRAGYVGPRYLEKFEHWRYPVPIKPGALDPMPAALFPESRRPGPKGDLDWRAAWPRPGIIVFLRDGMTAAAGEYFVEIDGQNGVWVVGRV